MKLRIGGGRCPWMSITVTTFFLLAGRVRRRLEVDSPMPISRATKGLVVVLLWVVGFGPVMPFGRTHFEPVDREFALFHRRL